MSAMIPAAAADLLATPGAVGILTTLGPKGEPQTTALWFLFEDGRVKISLNTTRQKTRNMTRDGRVSFFLADPANPYRTVELRGTADVQPDPEYAFAGRIGAAYGGADLRDNDGPGESRVVVTITPDKVLTFGI